MARSVSQVESLREVWTSLAGDRVQSDLDYFLWSLEEAHVVRPHVLAVERDGTTEAILVARVADVRLRCKLGYWTVYAPVVRAIAVMGDGLLGRTDPVIAAAVLDELCSAVDRREADAIVFRQLERDSVLDRAAAARSTVATRQHGSHTELRWQIDLPPTLGDYLASLSSSTRKGIRRTSSRLEQELGERLSIRVFRDSADLDVFVTDAERVAERTYQRGLGVGFLGNGAQRTKMAMLAEHGWFRGYVLYLDRVPIAFEQGELYGGRFHSVSAGYDPAFGRYRVGAYLLVKAIEDLATDPAVTIFDFGFGDAEYKRKLGHRALREGDSLIYARRLRPIRINFGRAVLLKIASGAKTGLRRLALLDALKHRLRRQIVAERRRHREPALECAPSDPAGRNRGGE